MDTSPESIRPSADPAIRALIEALPDPVVILEGDRIACANAPARALFPRLRPGDLLALVLRAPDILDAAETVLTSGTARTVAWRERVPVERLFDVRLAPFELPGAKRRVVLTLHDLTEAHRVERMRVDFIANASHELRTPLSSMLGFVETLQGAAREDAKAREHFLTIMRDQGRRMARLIEDLLSLSRIEQSQHVRPEARVDLGDVLAHVLATLCPVAAEQAVTVDYTSPAEALAVRGDRDELLRVAENLIENAIKYGADDAGLPTRVEVSLTAARGQAMLRVRDHGRGIPPEHLPRLTERFYRVDAGQSRAKGGTGLGLAIVKHIVARHRGRLAIESELGKGATFSIFLPLYEADKA